MKIGINLIQYTDVQGIEVYTKNILEALFAIDKDNEYILFVNKISKKLFNFTNDNIKYKEINLSGKNKIILILYQQLILPFILIKEKINLLYCPSIACPIFFKNKIVTILDCAFVYFKEKNSLFFLIYVKLLIFYLKYFNGLVITISVFSKKDIVEKLKLKEENIKIVYCGAPKLLEIDELKRKEIIRKFGLMNKRFIFYIGNFHSRKNIKRSLEAFNLIRDNYPDITFVLAGKMIKEFNKKFLASNNVKYLGIITDEEKSALYRSGLFFVFCSLYEGFGLPVLEAQSLNIPVLTSNLSSLPEVAGDGAIFVDPYSIEDISQKMSDLINDDILREDLIIKGQNNIKRFYWRDSANVLLEIFNSR